ncbi:hypothetical protein [Paractinoplanes atraurantiacus]|uniref:Uncharacterized protein n=1 Tax=Paractinoplanes atraurantiacus TaxID=1036182 RepID=A0A285KL64_9ACTN|nr:hypothetical protein [Actinoplanes atraurantiacus]SNY72021.1 hypothetical protein SAMN05421748_14147 [Actinoplanes atraurantiacus]
MQLGSLAELVSAFGAVAALLAVGVAARAAVNRQQTQQLTRLDDAESRRGADAHQRDPVDWDEAFAAGELIRATTFRDTVPNGDDATSAAWALHRALRRPAAAGDG